MKRAFQKILPILLGIAVICSIAWYLFVYDTGFTRDLLLYQARYLESQGNHSAAAKFYDLAYRQSGDNEAVAIELAEQFKAIGNFTKAEVTLSNAIADGGSVELYIALCKTYVEQDKLLDAVNMMENVSDPQIKAQLESLRPQAPTATVTPGFYSQYIPVGIECESGALYVTTDQTFPSAEDDAFSGEITLVAGENTIYALAVGENGLVSPLSIFGYTVGGVIEEVNLPDSTIDSLVRQQLGVSADVQLYTNDFWGITAFSIPSTVTDYSFLTYFSNLEMLIIESGSYEDLQALSALTKLETLVITGSSVSAKDLAVIAALPRLQNLTISGCQLSSIENLSNARNLQVLDLSNNAIRNVDALSFTTGLRELNLSYNALENLSGLSALAGLEKLNISYNSISSIIPLSACTALKELDVSHNALTSISAVENLRSLTYFSGAYNALTDVTPLENCAAMTVLDISGNELTDISMLSGLTKMQQFNFSYNQVTALPALGQDCALVYINGSHNQLQTLFELSGCMNLNQVMMDYNDIGSVNPLAQCPNLILVSVYGNPVNEVSSLTEQSIIVYYDPT